MGRSQAPRTLRNKKNATPPAYRNLIPKRALSVCAWPGTYLIKAKGNCNP